MKRSLLAGVALAALALLLAPLGCEPAGTAPSGTSSATSSATPSASPSASSALASSASAPGSASAPAARPSLVREGSMIARAPTSDALFVADEDHRVVRAVPLPIEVKAARVDFQVPGRPAQVIALRDRVLVTIRQVDQGEGALLVLKRTEGLGLEEAGRVTLPADAWGIAVTPDEGTAIVSSAWTHQLSAVDLRTLAIRWSIDVAREPRGIVVLPSGDRAYVTHLIGGDLTRVDGIASSAPTVTRVELPASPMRSPYGVKLSASLGYAAIASPSGDRVYVARHALGAMGPDSWSGQGAIDILLTAKETAAAPARAARPTAHFASFIAGEMEKSHWLAGSVPVIERESPVVEARALAYRRKTETLLVANQGNDRLVELDARALDPTLGQRREYDLGRNFEPILRVANHGSAPAGVVLSASEDEAYVYCAGTDDIVVVKLAPSEGRYTIVPPLAVALAPDDKPSVGKRLFTKAWEGVISGGLSCAGCHPEGRDDGQVWREAKISLQGERETTTFTNFFAGADLTAIAARWGKITAEGEGGFGYARQTPMLVHRVSAKGPYGWHGESPNLEARIIAGFGLHRWSTGWGNDTMARAFAGHLATFVREGLVPPPRPARPLTPEEQRGKAIFESPAAQCATCHVPASGYTDRNPTPLKRLRAPQGFADDPDQAYKTPSLLFVGGSPPYMHDGRFLSLESLIEMNQDRMGKTAQLSDDDKKALIAFLRTL